MSDNETIGKLADFAHRASQSVWGISSFNVKRQTEEDYQLSFEFAVALNDGSMCRHTVNHTVSGVFVDQYVGDYSVELRGMLLSKLHQYNQDQRWERVGRLMGRLAERYAICYWELGIDFVPEIVILVSHPRSPSGGALRIGVPVSASILMDEATESIVYGVLDEAIGTSVKVADEGRITGQGSYRIGP